MYRAASPLTHTLSTVLRLESIKMSDKYMKYEPLMPCYCGDIDQHIKHDNRV